MASLTLHGIAKSFGPQRVLGGIDLDVADGEFISLVGPSGCGKSTLVRIIAGLERQDSGSVAIGGASVDQLRPHERKVAMVFQSYALYPHMSVAANIAMPLVMSRLSLLERLPLLRLLSLRRGRVMQAIEAEVKAVADQLQIGALLGRRPAQLSGGQRQRVALGRAMVRHPDIFLMDEPLSNLDAKLRVHMRAELAELHQKLGTTFIYVTHDQVEAMTMSDRVAMMDAGSILQLGTPSALYERPADIKVAQFIGSPAINLLPALVDAEGRVTLFGRTLPIQLKFPAGAAVTLGVRPEAIEPAQARDGLIPAKLRRKENLGSDYILHFDVLEEGGGTVLCRTRTDTALSIGGEQPIGLRFDPAACHLFDAGGARIEPLSAEAAPKAAVAMPA